MSAIMKRPPPNTSIMPPLQHTAAATTNNQTFVEKIMIGMDHAPQQFDLRGQLIGAGGANLHYIRNETGAIATLRGRGSMFIEPLLGTESLDPMHLYIEHPRFDGLQSAKQLAKNLIETLQQELSLFHQQQPPVAQPTAAQQYNTPSILHQTGQLGALQMSVPPPTLSVPPPAIVAQTQSAPTDQSHDDSMLKIPPPGQPSTMHSVPINVHPGNIIVHQQQAPAAQIISNVSVPPPALPMKPNQMLHLQGPPPNHIQLSQPPPSIQLHQTLPPNAQLLLNQPPQNVQYQYIQQLPLQPQSEIAAPNPSQVTIQHIYQAQNNIQGLVQTNQTQAHFNPFAEVQRQAPHFPSGQQFFVQGNNAFIVPPPNIVHTTQPKGTQECPTNQSIIFHTQPPPNHIQVPQVQSVDAPPVSIATETKSANDDAQIKPISPKREASSPQTTQLDESNHGVKSDADPVEALATHSDAITQLMSIPPPITCVQHIVGNTLITTAQPANQEPQKIYSQIPVSIQQAPQQQIHVSTQNGQHFFVHAQQWAQQSAPIQHVPQGGFHLTAQPLLPSADPNRPSQILTTTFNPQQLQNAAAGLQVQFQQLQPTTHQQHFIQQFPAVSMAQLIEQSDLQSNQMHFHTMPPSYTVATIHQPAANQALIDSFVPRLGIPHLSGAQSLPTPMAKTNIVDTQLRIGQKRKLDEDAAKHRDPRSGVGSSGSIFANPQQQPRTDPTTHLLSQQHTQHQHQSSTFVSKHTSADLTTTTAQIASSSLTTTASHTSSSNVQDKPDNGSESHCEHDKDAVHTQRTHQQPSDLHGHYSYGDQLDNFSAAGSYGEASGHPMRCQQSRHPFHDTRDHHRNRTNGGLASNYPMRPPPPALHMRDVNFPMHRMNFGPPPPPPYGPPPPHFRQW